MVDPRSDSFDFTRAPTAAAAAAAAAGLPPTLPPVGSAAGGGAAPDTAEPLPTAGEVELRERLRLEALERRTRSLRAPSVVQTFRSAESRQAAAEPAAPPAPRETSDRVPAAAGGPVVGSEAAIPPPHPANLPGADTRPGGGLDRRHRARVHLGVLPSRRIVLCDSGEVACATAGHEAAGPVVHAVHLRGHCRAPSGKSTDVCRPQDQDLHPICTLRDQAPRRPCSARARKCLNNKG